MRGKANLGQALLDASEELLVFGSEDIPRIVIIFSNGQPRYLSIPLLYIDLKDYFYHP